MTDAKRILGDEYPAAVTIEGARLPFLSEGRWSREYGSKEAGMRTSISRFMDGTASITFPELASEWPSWNDRERHEFCGACSWLSSQTDFPDMLRLMMQHGGPDEWSALALLSAEELPQDEAFEILVGVLHSMEPGDGANISQGISHTKHPGAGRVLRERLAQVWSHPGLWEEDSFYNSIAYDATRGIAHLIELGASPECFESEVRQLSRHACARNRDSCRFHLSEYYPWLHEQRDSTKDT